MERGTESAEVGLPRGQGVIADRGKMRLSVSVDMSSDMSVDMRVSRTEGLKEGVWGQGLGS